MLLESRIATCAAVLLLHWLPNTIRIGIVMQPLIQFTPFCSMLMLALHFTPISPFFLSPNSLLILLHNKPPPTINKTIPFNSCKHESPDTISKKKSWSNFAGGKSGILFFFGDETCLSFKRISDEEFLRRCNGKNLKEIKRALRLCAPLILSSAESVLMTLVRNQWPYPSLCSTMSALFDAFILLSIIANCSNWLWREQSRGSAPEVFFMALGTTPPLAANFVCSVCFLCYPAPSAPRSRPPPPLPLVGGFLGCVSWWNIAESARNPKSNGFLFKLW